MKNVILRALGLALLIGVMAMTNATISAYGAQIGQDRTLIAGSDAERKIEALSRNLLISAATTSSISTYEAEAFFAGFAITRAMYFSADALRDREFVPEAKKVLLDLIDFLKGRPEERPLRLALQTLMSGNGNVNQLIALFDQAIETHTSALRGSEVWYFYTGMVVTQIKFSMVYENDDDLQADLRLLQRLIDNAPPSATAGLVAPLREIARFAPQTSFSDRDYTAIGNSIVSIVDVVFS